MRKFADKYDLDFTLLADADHKVAEAYGAWGEKSMYGKQVHGACSGRPSSSTPRGRSPGSSRRSQPKTHDEVVLEALAELQAA